MAQFQNLMEILKLLEKSNCRKCNEPTCMAFAAAVFRGDKQLSECPHQVAADILAYIFGCRGKPVEKRWVPLRELPHGQDWYRFFGQQCEKPLKRLADTYTDLFEDLVEIFNGRQVDNHYQSDVAVVLHPLPLVPILICYWKPEEGMASDLNVFFDATAEDNLGIGEIYATGTGIVRMFEKLARRHGGEEAKYG